ncbi:MAG TPA: enolase C-terminal domain-like protein [Verrucomicrobiae bacterium]
MDDNIQRIEASAFTIPTETPESDGTAEWSSTTLILVRVEAEGTEGLGYTYAHECCAPFIRKTLFPIVLGKSPFATASLWNEMNVAVRNFGRDGVVSSSIAAVEMALWDLKARLLKLPFVKLLGAVRDKIPVYGSGGFTSYSDEQLSREFSKWIAEGILMVKMKVGRQADLDPARVAVARRAIGDSAQLFVDANGAYSTKQALRLAAAFSEQNVRWFEEPVSSNNLPGLRFIREHTPLLSVFHIGRNDSDMDVAAGEYNYDLRQARTMLEAEAVDVLQADATRCGITGFLQTAELCEAFEIPLSAHTAPALHAHLCCATRRVRHVEYFFDHVRIEQMLFDGPTTRQESGYLRPDLQRPGFGLEFKASDAEKFKVNI